MATRTGTAGNDNLFGTNGKDTFRLFQGGEDKAHGRSGNDTFNMGAAFDAGDRIDGGSGTDTVQLNGDYSAYFAFTATTIKNVEAITMAAGHSYWLALNDANVGAGKTLSLDASALGAANGFQLDGMSESDGRFKITGGAGGDIIYASNGNDTVDLSRGGDDGGSGEGGDDTYLMGGALNRADQLSGGPGFDTVVLNGNYASGLVLDNSTLLGFEAIVMRAGHTYDLTTDDDTAGGAPLKIDASALKSSNVLRFDGSAETADPLTVLGGLGNDTIRTGAGADTVRPGGGRDFISTGAGADTIDLGKFLDGADRINGGAGNDVLKLKGTYTGAHALVCQANTLANVESIVLAGGYDYDLTLNAGNLTYGTNLLVNASALIGTDSLKLTGASTATAGVNVDCGAGNDVIRNAHDVDFTKGGKDTAVDCALVYMGATLTPADRITRSTVLLNGNYSGAHKLVLGQSTFKDIVALDLSAGHDYDVKWADGNASAGHSTIVSAGGLSGTDTVTFNGAAETNAIFKMVGSAAVCDFTGGAKADSFFLAAGPTTVHGGGGDDIVTCTSFNNNDRIDGGAGHDTVVFDTGAPLNLAFGSLTLQNVETLLLPNSYGVTLTTNDANVAANKTLTVDGSFLVFVGFVSFDGTAETNGRFVLIGGPNGDTFQGGARNDVLQGGGSQDILFGGGGNDTFVYKAVTNSTSTYFDGIGDFNANKDHIDLPFTVKGLDPTVTTGALTNANFDGDLAAAVGAGQLGKHHAVLFTPSSGDFNGYVFVIVDANNVAGYQAGHDYVIQLIISAGSLHLSDFI